MEELELACFKIIASAGVARSNYMELIEAVKRGDRADVSELHETAKAAYLEAHKAHTELLTQEANGCNTKPSMLLIHAEDQLMMTEAFEVMAKEFTAVYARLETLEKKEEV